MQYVHRIHESLLSIEVEKNDVIGLLGILPTKSFSEA